MKTEKMNKKVEPEPFDKSTVSIKISHLIIQWQLKEY